MKLRYKLLAEEEVKNWEYKTIACQRASSENEQPWIINNYVLEQWWENITDGGGEWRQIEIIND